LLSSKKRTNVRISPFAPGTELSTSIKKFLGAASMSMRQSEH
jgi:hypothetical protein